MLICLPLSQCFCPRGRNSDHGPSKLGPKLKPPQTLCLPGKWCEFLSNHPEYCIQIHIHGEIQGVSLRSCRGQKPLNPGNTKKLRKKMQNPPCEFLGRENSDHKKSLETMRWLVALSLRVLDVSFSRPLTNRASNLAL